jgi:hypothetical protein
MGNQPSQSNTCQVDKIVEYLNWIPSYETNSLLEIQDIYFKKEDKEYLDLRNKISDIYDQDECHLQIIKTFSIVFKNELFNENLSIINPSLSYILFYLKKRYINNCFSYQYLFDIIQTYGVCSEKAFSSNLENIENGIPDQSHYQSSQVYKFILYFKLPRDIKKIKMVLSNQKLIMIGLPVYTQFLKTRTDIELHVPIDNDKYIGGLSGIITGFNDKKEMLTMQIHHGKYWGNEGSIEIPYNYITESHGIELWIIDLNRKMIDIQHQTIQSMQTTDNIYASTKEVTVQPKLEFHPFGV